MKFFKDTIFFLILNFVGTQLVYGTGRAYLNIVGSSTVYPFSASVAEYFSNSTNFPSPIIESTGTGGGFKLFCEGVGVNYPDINNASRPIKESEKALCRKNGINSIIEVKIGYDGIVLANTKKSALMNLSPRHIYLALAREIPDGKGNLVANYHKTWNSVDSSLPNKKIVVFGPPPTSGTRDAFVELALEAGCKTFDSIKALKKKDKKAYKAVCHSIREDGVYIEAGENDNVIIHRLEIEPSAFGILGFSFLDQNMNRIQGSLINGVSPEFSAIASGDYPVSRSLFFYVKGEHLKHIPGFKRYLTEFLSEKALGDEGYLSDKGLIPLSSEERKKQSQSIQKKLSLIK